MELTSLTKKYWLRAVAIGFGLLTIKEGGTILFGDEAARTAAGNYVLFVLWFNFVAGFAYIIAGAGLWMLQRWAVWLSVLLPRPRSPSRHLACM